MGCFLNSWVPCPMIAHVAGAGLAWVGGELVQKAMSRSGSSGTALRNWRHFWDGEASLGGGSRAP